jgi:hypothetical protein
MGFRMARCSAKGRGGERGGGNGRGRGGPLNDSDVEESNKAEYEAAIKAKRAKALNVVTRTSGHDVNETRRDVPSKLTWRDNLYIANSNLLEIGQQPGLFTNQQIPKGLFTNQQIPKGSFICFYGGKFYQPEEWDKLDYEKRNSLERYAVGVNETSNSETANFKLVPNREADDTMNFEKNPGAAANEPNKGDDANAFLQASVFDVPNDTDFKSYLAIALYACRDITAGEEILWNYGEAYENVRKRVPYTAGLPCVAEADQKEALRRVEEIANVAGLREWALYPIEVNVPDSGSDSDYRPS